MPILRENIDSKYKWNLEKIYKNNKDFENELENIRKQDKNMNKKLFDINYAKNKLNEYLKNDIEA